MHTELQAQISLHSEGVRLQEIPFFEASGDVLFKSFVRLDKYLKTKKWEHAKRPWWHFLSSINLKSSRPTREFELVNKNRRAFFDFCPWFLSLDSVSWKGKFELPSCAHRERIERAESRRAAPRASEPPCGQGLISRLNPPFQDDSKNLFGWKMQ